MKIKQPIKTVAEMITAAFEGFTIGYASVLLPLAGIGAAV